MEEAAHEIEAHIERTRESLGSILKELPDIRLGPFVIFSNLRPESRVRYTPNGKYARFQDIVWPNSRTWRFPGAPIGQLYDPFFATWCEPSRGRSAGSRPDLPGRGTVC